MRIRNIRDAHLKINKAKNIIGVDDLKTKLDPKKFNALEIGSGKGGFIYQKAITNPGINYFGIEKMLRWSWRWSINLNGLNN
ncbi:hypothetical protein RUS48_01895 [Mycoplasmoides gallisepticum]|nr:hypothetical protein RUS48_01895 [Mycoplasmoides gallisepticum]